MNSSLAWPQSQHGSSVFSERFGIIIGFSHSSSQVSAWKCEKCHNNANRLAAFINVCQTASVSRPLHCFLSCSCLIIVFSPARCCACEVWSITRDSVFISPPPGRRVRGHLFNWSILTPVLWQRRRYRRAHCPGRALALHFPQWRRKVLKWKSVRRRYFRKQVCVVHSQPPQRWGDNVSSPDFLCCFVSRPAGNCVEFLL